MMSDSKNKVISLNNYRSRQNSASEKAPPLKEPPENENLFFQAIKKNMEQKEKIKMERMKTNKQVLKSYNIKK